MRKTTLFGLVGVAGALAVAAGVVVDLQPSAQAQTKSTPAKSDRSPAAAHAKPGAVQVAAVPPEQGATAKSAWVSRCSSATRKAVPECVMEQTAVLTKTGQLVTALTIRVPAGTGTPVMMVHVPVGLYLPYGIKMQIDDRKPVDLVVQTCDLKGCYSGMQISPDLLGKLKTGKHLAVSFQNLAKQNISVPLTLAEFDKAYQRIQ
jgi:invasion protein IalB